MSRQAFQTYLLLPAGGYSTNVSDYVVCRSYAEIQLTLSRLDTQHGHVYLVPNLVWPSVYAVRLSLEIDPYPDFVAEIGPRGGLRWERA